MSTSTPFVYRDSVVNLGCGVIATRQTELRMALPATGRTGRKKKLEKNMRLSYRGKDMSEFGNPR